MKRKYYIFQKNKVVHQSGQAYPQPLNQKGMDTLSRAVTPQTMEKLPNAEGSFVVEMKENSTIPEDFATISLRGLVGLVDESLFADWGKAAQILHWSKANRFCGHCGAETVLHQTDPARVCTRCERLHYPVTTPCIIVLIYRGDEILLARSPRFPEKMFSTLAGFVDPGESAEQTLHREIFEEVHLKVKNVDYFSSQFWPFPGQLMLGFFAEYAEGEIEVDGKEIVSADWFHCKNLPNIPGPGTIAGKLIRLYVQEKSNLEV